MNLRLCPTCQRPLEVDELERCAICETFTWMLNVHARRNGAGRFITNTQPKERQTMSKVETKYHNVRMSASHSIPIGAGGFEPDFEVTPYLTIPKCEAEIRSIHNAFHNAWRQGRTIPESSNQELAWWEHQLEVLKEAQQAYDTKPI